MTNGKYGNAGGAGRARRLRTRLTGLAACMIAPFAFATEAQAQFHGSDLYTITARISGKVLDIDSSWLGGGWPGRELLQWDSHGGQNQHFFVAPVPDRPGEYRIRAQHSGQCLDVPAGSPDGTIVRQWACDESYPPNQAFRIAEAGGGYYRIEASYMPSAIYIGLPSGSATDSGIRATLQPLNAGCLDDRRMMFTFASVR